MNTLTPAPDAERENLQADLDSLLIEIERAAPPEHTSSLFAPGCERDRLVLRYWKSRFALDCYELLALNRALLDRMRSLLAVGAIVDSLSGTKRSNRQKLSDVKLIGMKVSPDQFDALDVRLKNAHLEREFKRALRKVGEGREL